MSKQTAKNGTVEQRNAPNIPTNHYKFNKLKEIEFGKVIIISEKKSLNRQKNGVASKKTLTGKNGVATLIRAKFIHKDA